VRDDLKKLSEVEEESEYKQEDMPRYTISVNQDHFNKLLSLLDVQNASSKAAWDLIQMLCTNPEIYLKVLKLEPLADGASQRAASDPASWDRFFNPGSIYKTLYITQIIESLMEEGEGEGMEKVVLVKPKTTFMAKKEDLEDEEIPTLAKKHSTRGVDEQDEEMLKKTWVKRFLDNHGLDYVLDKFMGQDLSSHQETSAATLVESFHLKQISFLLTTLRIFIMAAFSAADPSVYTALAFAR